MTIYTENIIWPHYGVNGREMVKVDVCEFIDCSSGLT